MSEFSTMLQEHEGVRNEDDDKKKQPQTYTPTEEEREIIRKCERMFEKAKKMRSKYDYDWVDFYKMFRGKQWKEQRPTYRSTEVFNLVWQGIQSQVPIIMDAKPRFEFRPTEPSDREFADLMNEVAEADWDKNNWSFTLTELLYDSHILGTGISCLKYDHKQDQIIYHTEDPFYIFPDPSAESLKFRCSYITHAEPTDLERAKKLFPKKANYLKADVVNFASEKRIDLSSVKYRSPSSDQIYVEVTGGYDNNYPPEVLIKTCHYKDDTTIDEEIINEQGIPQVVKKLKYPNGRKTVYTNNDVLLFDGPYEYEDDQGTPYQRLINYVSSRNFWGISEIEPIASPQRVFNKLVCYVLDVLFLTGNPIWVVDTTSGIDTDNITNQPGLIIEKEPGSEVRRESGVQLQPYVLSIIDRMKEIVEQLMGSQDVTRGIAPGSVTAASAIEDLQNAAQSRMRLKMKNLDAYLQDFGQQYASRVMQFYTAPKVFRVTQKNGTDKYFKMHITSNEEGFKTAHVFTFNDNGLLNPTGKEYQLRGKLDVKVTTGSGLPFSKAEKERQLFAYFDRGVIDEEELLKSTDFPNWQAVHERVQRKKEALAQQQQMMKNTSSQQAA